LVAGRLRVVAVADCEGYVVRFAGSFDEFRALHCLRRVGQLAGWVDWLILLARDTLGPDELVKMAAINRH
jgi:hypothetical protein